MATNPAGKGTKTVGLNMSAKMAGELEARAESMQISTSKYCKLILMDWIKSGKARKGKKVHLAALSQFMLTLGCSCSHRS